MFTDELKLNRFGRLYVPQSAIQEESRRVLPSKILPQMETCIRIMIRNLQPNAWRNFWLTIQQMWCHERFHRPAWILVAQCWQLYKSSKCIKYEPSMGRHWRGLCHQSLPDYQLFFRIRSFRGSTEVEKQFKLIFFLLKFYFWKTLEKV